MRRFWQWLCGYIRIHVYGRQVNRFINLCSRNGIRLWKITYDMQNALKASICLRDFYDLKPFLRKTKTKLRVVSRKGFPFWCYRHPRMRWFWIFLLVFACFGIYSLGFVWKIEIQGNNHISTEEILDCLGENKVYKYPKQ